MVLLLKRFMKLLLFERFKIQTTASTNDLLKSIESLIEAESDDYYGHISEDRFFIGEKNRKYHFGGQSRNSLAPIATGKIQTAETGTTVSVTVRMNLLSCIVLIPIYFCCALCFLFGTVDAILQGIGAMAGAGAFPSYELFLPFPIMLILLFFAFWRPAKRLRKKIEAALDHSAP